MKRSVLALVYCFATTILFGNTVDSTLVNKYLALADTWGTIKYLHPVAASNPSGWNSAFIEAIRDLEKDTKDTDEASLEQRASVASSVK